MEIKDSGKREEFPTGSRRDTREGKGRYDLLPPYAMHRLARHFEQGSAKYSERNWEKGQPLSRYMDSALRHLFKHLGGERDEPHLAAAAWNLMCAMDTEERINRNMLPSSLNDLPTNQRGPDHPADKVAKAMEEMDAHDRYLSKMSGLRGD